MQALDKAIAAAGSAAALGRAIGVSEGYARHLRNGVRPMTHVIAVKIEAVTGIKVEALMPDVRWIRSRGRVVAYLVPVPVP
jgi:DNA-binding transcriptional regulator YdaS (Cro superfamily)